MTEVSQGATKSPYSTPIFKQQQDGEHDYHTFEPLHTTQRLVAVLCKLLAEFSISWRTVRCYLFPLDLLLLRSLSGWDC